MKTSWKFDAEIFTNNNPSIFSLLAAQAERVETVYFEFDKYDLDDQQQKNILDFMISRHFFNRIHSNIWLLWWPRNCWL
jgi:hypothetical protein